MLRAQIDIAVQNFAVSLYRRMQMTDIQLGKEVHHDRFSSLGRSQNVEELAGAHKRVLFEVKS